MLVGATSKLFAEDRISLDKEAIIGNKEAPKAIYIVPWRALVPSGMQSLEIGALLDEELEMIDPEVFRRQIELYDLVYSEK